MSAAEKEGKDGLMLASLRSDYDRCVGYCIAMHLKAGRREAAGALVGLPDTSPRMFEYVAKALRGEFRLTPKREKIIRAYCAACGAAAKAQGIVAGEPFWGPTMLEVKIHYAISDGRKPPPGGLARLRKWVKELENLKEIPGNESFRDPLNGMRLPIQKDKRGPPPGSRK